MTTRYDDIARRHALHADEEARAYDSAASGAREMADDARRVADLYANAEDELASIDERFRAATKLDKTDAAFLMLATALQVGRWIILGELNGAANRKVRESRRDHDDKRIVDKEKERRGDYADKHGSDPHKKGPHRDWANIVFDGVPYDVTKGCTRFGVNMAGKHHRIHALGHDPVLGWIFGTMNILSDTITLDKSYAFRTFEVDMSKGRKRWT